MALFTKEESLAYHEEPRPGKLEVLPVKPCFTQKDLSMAYSPRRRQRLPRHRRRSFPRQCLYRARQPRGRRFQRHRRPRARQHRPPRGQAGHGRQERALQGVRGRERYDINLALTDPDKIIEVVKALEPTFGGINLEDIKAPSASTSKRCSRRK